MTRKRGNSKTDDGLRTFVVEPDERFGYVKVILSVDPKHPSFGELQRALRSLYDISIQTTYVSMALRDPPYASTPPSPWESLNEQIMRRNGFAPDVPRITRGGMLGSPVDYPIRRATETDTDRLMNQLLRKNVEDAGLIPKPVAETLAAQPSKPSEPARITERGAIDLGDLEDK